MIFFIDTFILIQVEYKGKNCPETKVKQTK